MGATSAELILIAAVFLLVLYAGGFFIVRKMRSAQNFHLMAPLVVAPEPTGVRLRLDAALRDAEEGFNACHGCGFENLKRNIFCSLCGAIVEGTSIAGDKSKENPHSQRQFAPTSENNRRKARALRRKEWMRKVDVEGKLFWFRDATHTNIIEQLGHGYVVHFDGDPLEDVTSMVHTTLPPETEPLLAEGSSEIDGGTIGEAVVDQSDHVTKDEEETRQSVIELSADDAGPDEGGEPSSSRPRHRLELRSLETTHELIASELSTRPLTLVDSHVANPSRPSVIIQPSSVFLDDPNTLIRNSNLDFPSKMAEFVTRASTAMTMTEQSYLKVKIARDKLLEYSIEALAAMPTDHCRCPMRMSFIGEHGIDAGGVYREWLEIVTQQIMSHDAGIFRCVDSPDRSFYLNPTSEHDIGEHHLAHVFAAGRLIGRMLLEGSVTGFHLAPPLLKIIVGQPVTFDDLEYFDVDAYKNLLWLLENEGVEALGLDFTVTEKSVKGETIIVELVPNGTQVNVTDVNKHEYVNLKFQYLLFGSVQNQLFAFLKGVYEVMPAELLMVFDAEEIDFVLSGSDEIDVDDWERNSKRTIDLADHPVHRWFWELVREMPNEYRRRLLLFSTGSSRVPLAGFAALTSYDGRLCPFMLKGVPVDYGGGYIRSRACFNQLDLPWYYKKSDLKTVLYAVLNTDRYGFTSA